MRQDAVVGLDAVASAPVVEPRPVVVPGRWTPRAQPATVSGAPLRPVDPPITLALIGGPRLVRDTTASLLGAQEGLRVAGSFESAAHFLAVGVEQEPELLLLDCDGGKAGECQRTVRTLSSAEAEYRIVLLCHELREDEVCCAIEHRVGGVLLKSYTTAEVRSAIAYVASGRTVMPAGWQRAIVPPPRERLALSPRHREILALIARGRGNEEIASELELSPNTIKFHIRALYSRLGVRNRVEAAKKHAQLTSGDA